MKRYIGVYQGTGFMGWGNSYEEVLERAKLRYEIKKVQKEKGRILWKS